MLQIDFKGTQDIETALDQYILTLLHNINLLCVSYVSRIEDWMKQNAPWNDITGDARAGLYCFLLENANAYVLTFGHSVDYGEYLETNYFGEYAIVAPALDYFQTEFFKDLLALQNNV